jgi:tRNA(fMet)-specific endonuclease VapC
MPYLLDSNVVIALLNFPRSNLARRVRQSNPADIAVSAIALHELFYGAFKARRAADNLALLDALQLEIIEFDKEDARQAGEIRASLAGKGTPIGPYDVLIAGQALSRDLVLVTRNVREFGRVENLRLENWES